jgi:hypothetical protein
MRITRNQLVFLLVWWTTVAFVYTEESVSVSRMMGTPLTWRDVLPVHLAGCLLWVPLSMFLIHLVRRFPLESGRRLRAALALTGGVGVAILVRGVFVYLANPATHWWYPAETPSLGVVLVHSVRANMVLSWLIVGVAHAFHYFERAQSSRVRIAELESKLTRAQLDALAAQLNPHFLFNTLNSIAELTHVDSAKADQMIVGLSALLRRSLERTGEQEVLVSDEMTLLALYVDIEKVRMGDRLHVEYRIDENSASCYVPIFLLLPLVENSITHGLAKRSTIGSIVVDIRREAAKLRLTISDNGDGEASTGRGHGIGLGNTAERLKFLYGDEQSIDVRQTASGTTVSLTIPARTSPTL